MEINAGKPTNGWNKILMLRESSKLNKPHVINLICKKHTESKCRETENRVFERGQAGARFMKML